jgi:signal transduction histidine kinase/CheY-like chemotaxis protein
VYYSPWLGQNVVMIAVPHYAHGKFAGVVMARLHLKVLNSLLTARLDDPRFRSTFVVDRKGNIISHYDFKMVEEGRNLAFLSPVVAALEGKSGWLKYDSPIDKSNRIGGYLQMPGTGWVVVASRKTGDSVLRLEERLQTQLVFAALAAILAGLIAWWWGRKLSRPLEDLTATMRGSQGVRFDPASVPMLAQTRVTRDVTEYETLAQVYNAMATQLLERFQETRSLNEKMQAQNSELNAQNVELAWLSAEAQESNRLKSEFLANMSHELRTPLNSIIGYTELVLTDESQELDPLNRSNLEIVLKNARHLLALINDILDLSKVESGKMTVFSEAFDPRQTVQGVVTATETLARSRGLTLEYVDREAPAQVESDETKLRQIILNLVSNAIKFTREGTVRVSIEERGPERWAVVVADTGIGIASEDQEMVFEEFRQVDASTTRQAGGTGLGLSIARKLARLLGGDLTLVSEPGVGSTFTLELPRHLVASELPRPALPLRVLAASHSHNRVVLAIDDDPQGQPLIAQKLRGTSYRVEAADGPETALEKARNLRPFAVLLDVKIRRMDDWRVLRELKADPLTADIPVIVTSFVENKALAYSMGAAAFLVKPVDQHQLVKVLERLDGHLKSTESYALLVGIDAGARQSFQQVLHRERMGLVEAVDGHDAVDVIEQKVPRVILLDLRTYQSDSFDLLAWLRAHEPLNGIPIFGLGEKPARLPDGRSLDMMRMTIPRGPQAEPLFTQGLRDLMDVHRPLETKE